VRDPDGNEWEVFVVLEDNLAEGDPCECGDKVAQVSDTSQAKLVSCCAATAVTVTRNFD
jgi:hypothetical protein